MFGEIINILISPSLVYIKLFSFSIHFVTFSKFGGPLLLLFVDNVSHCEPIMFRQDSVQNVLFQNGINNTIYTGL